MTIQDEREFSAADLNADDFGMGGDDFDDALQAALKADAEPLGDFEGTPIDGVEIKVTGVSKLGEAYSGLKLSLGDRVRLAVEARVIDVGAHLDKDDNLIRTQVVKAFAVDLIPWNPNDPSDRGVIRA